MDLMWFLNQIFLLLFPKKNVKTNNMLAEFLVFVLRHNQGKI